MYEAPFCDILSTLSDQVYLSQNDSWIQHCIFTDANDRFWNIVVTQCILDKLNVDVLLLVDLPLALLSEEFTVAELGWTTFEKDSFAIT